MRTGPLSSAIQPLGAANKLILRPDPGPCYKNLNLQGTGRNLRGELSTIHTQVHTTTIHLVPRMLLQYIAIQLSQKAKLMIDDPPRISRA